MKTKRKQFGLSLTEVLTSIVIVVLLAAMSMPAINALVNSTSSPGSSEAMISAAMSNARAIAMREQRYVGIRFQMEGSQNTTGWPFINADQYIIFIIHDNQNTGLANGFRAANGMKPIKLPENIRVTDLTVSIAANGALSDVDNGNVPVFNDISTFSIVFSPQGNLVIHDVRVWNKNGNKNDSSRDDIFNTQTNVENFKAMFYQDDYPDLGLSDKNEPSRRQFYIYEQDKFKRAYEQEPPKPYSGYLIQLKAVYINLYTGTIISAGQ